MNPSSPQSKLRTWTLLAPVRGLGYLAWICMGIAGLVQVTDFARRELQGLINEALQHVETNVLLEGVQVDWLGPGITVRKLTVRDGEREHLFLNNIYLSAHYSWETGFSLDRVDVDGGRLLLSQAGLDQVRALTDSDPTVEASELHLQLPAIEVRQLEASFELPGEAIVPLGTVEVSMKAPRDGSSEVLGLVRLPQNQDGESAFEMFLNGRVEDTGTVELNALVKDFELSDWQQFPFANKLQLPADLPSGLLSIYSRGSLHLLGHQAAEGELRLRLREGNLQVPGTPEPLKDLNLEFAATFKPGPEEDLWSSHAWRGSFQLQANWDKQALAASALLGAAASPGKLLNGWAGAPSFQINTPALKAIRSPELLPTIFSALDPAGQGNARAGFSISESVADEDLISRFELLFRLDTLGPVTAQYNGWPTSDDPNELPMGFRVPAIVNKGTVVFAHTPHLPRWDLADVRFEGIHPEGPVHGSFQSWSNPVDMPPFARGYGEVELDLLLHVEGVQLNEELDEHLEELWQLPALGTLMDEFGVQSGTVGADIRVSVRAALEGVATDVAVHVEGAQASYQEFPIPATEVSGKVISLSNGSGTNAFNYDFTGLSPSKERFYLSGRARMQGPVESEEPRPSLLQVTQVRLDEISLPGNDLPYIEVALPPITQVVKDYAPEGTLSFELTRTQVADDPASMWIEISPVGDGFQLLPEIFPVLCENVAGRVLVDITLPANPEGVENQSRGEPVVVTRIAPLTATYAGVIPISFRSEIRSHQETWGKIQAAGLSTLRTDLIAELLSAAGQSGEEILADLSSFEFPGQIDFDYHFAIPVDEASPADLRYNLRVRDMIVRHEDGIQVDDVRGVLLSTNGRMHADAFVGRVGTAQLQLNNIEIIDDETNELGLQITAQVEPNRISLDPVLLGQILGEEAARGLMEEFKLRGTLQILEGQASLTIPKFSPIELRLKGKGTMSDAFVSLGIPFSVRSAQVALENFSVIGDDVRGWGRVENLYGQAMDRDMTQTNFLLSFQGSQVTVQDIDGLFCRGTMRGLGSEAARTVPAPALSLSLAPPYQFQAGLELKGLDVRLLLEDVFSSGIADRGLLDANFRISGDFQHLLDIEGIGSGRVHETVLWSVPVLRELLSQLGMDETAVFDAMETDFRIVDGKVQMEGISMHSPIFKLRGAGTLGLDGTLHHDLELHYSLVDKAGLFGDLIHWIQNSLIAISIRGDMARPQVLLRGVFSNPFTDLDDNWRGLPSPSYRPLPARF